mmetsp:Transcript_18138/g.25562  ORF Transcript_18138/g.25562 Transcript_18138/m.25562 type:complete len:126 (+) Transcript_18138:152-529(+)
MKYASRIQLVLLLVGLVSAVALEQTGDDVNRLRSHRHLTAKGGKGEEKVKGHWHMDEMVANDHVEDFITAGDQKEEGDKKGDEKGENKTMAHDVQDSPTQTAGGIGNGVKEKRKKKISFERNQWG